MIKLTTQSLDRIPPERHSRLDNNISACGQELRGHTRSGKIRLDWIVAYTPFISLFIAKSPHKRTVRQIMLGSVTPASLGCGLFYLFFGNFGLHLQTTSQLDVPELIKTVKGATAIMAMANSIPLSDAFKLVFAMITTISMTTTFDAIPFALAATTPVKLTPDDEPACWNRLFWAISPALVLMGMLLIDGPFSILQTASIVVGLPVLIVLWLGVTVFSLKYNQHRLENQTVVFQRQGGNS